jgi:hypothetical protein
VLGRFPSDLPLLAAISRAALEGDAGEPLPAPKASNAGGGGGDSGGAGSGGGGLTEREGMLLGLLEQHPGFAEVAGAALRYGGGGGGGGEEQEGEEQAEGRGAVLGALCGHAGRLFQARRYAAAARFYGAAMAFAEVRALCHVGGSFAVAHHEW